MPKVYISGPITGIVDLNKAALEEAEELLKDHGFEPVNPHKLHADAPEDHPYESYLKTDIKALMDCDIVALLQGWEESKGSLLEVGLALKLMIPCFRIDCLDSLLENAYDNDNNYIGKFFSDQRMFLQLIQIEKVLQSR